MVKGSDFVKSASTCSIPIERHPIAYIICNADKSNVTRIYYEMFMQETRYDEFLYGLAVRIPGFHPGGSGLTAGMGKQVVVFTAIFNNNNNNGNNDNGDDNDKDKLLKYFINFNIIQFNTIASLHVCILFFI